MGQFSITASNGTKPLKLFSWTLNSLGHLFTDGLVSFEASKKKKCPREFKDEEKSLKIII